MSIINWFNKPKWQNPNEKVRLTAVSHAQDPLLLKALMHIATDDKSIAVRKAALNRIDDYNDIILIANKNDDKSLKQLAFKKICDWMAAIDDATQQMPIAEQIKDQNTIEQLAKNAKAKGIRAFMLDQISKQGLLGDLIIAEPDTGLQEKILKKIHQPSTLNRIASHFKRKNKGLYKTIQDLLTNDKTSDTNEDEAALSLCTRLESLVHQKTTVENIDLKAIATQWEEIRDRVSPTLVQRYVGAYRTAQVIIDPQQREKFLQKQKHQRLSAQMAEMQQHVDKAHDLELKKVQDLINRFNQMDLEYADETQKHAQQQGLEQLIQIRDKKTEEQQIPEGVTRLFDQLVKELGKEIVQPDRLKFFRKQWNNEYRKANSSVGLQQLSHQFDNNMQKLAEKIENSAQARDKSATQAVDLLEAAAKSIADGHLNDAKRIINQVAELKKTAGFSHPIIKKNKFRFDQTWNKLKELRQWQKWSNDKIRNDIIQELKDLIGTGLHPDAVLKKLQDSNQRWYQLEDMEKLEGDKYPTRNRQLWAQFREVSQQLFEPAQPFYEKRSEIQNQKTEEYDALIEELNNCDLDAATERDLARLSRTAIKYLKTLDNLPPKVRGRKAKQLRAGISRIDAKLEEFYSVAERRKTKLIEMALELAEVESMDEAINTAKALQEEWKSAGIVRPHTERKLWKKFRKANDAVFNRRNVEKEQEQEAYQQQQKEAEQFIKDAKQQLKSLTDASALQGFIDKTQSEWKSFNLQHKGLSKKLRDVLNQAEQQEHQLAMGAVAEELDQLVIADQICTDYGFTKIDQPSAEEKLSALENQLKSAIYKQFAERLAKPMDQYDSDESEAIQQQLNTILIAAEYLTGNETPEAQANDRMNYQVERLSNRMAGESHHAQDEEARQLLTDWYLTPKLDQAFLKSSKKRIDNNLKALKHLILK
ncbi:DUF349 domain-containing protein [Marinicella sp. W31]|uniref:DUF349 domain-containing protein n=1 Tax=Marinicella sp. W31 TaxID=3023713 RepID=UPI003757194F